MKRTQDENSEEPIVPEGTTDPIQIEKNEQLLQSSAVGDFQNVSELLRQDADVWCRDNLGRTPLHLAALTGNEETVVLLLNYGAPWNALDNSGTTTGEYAMRSGKKKVYDLILEAGCRVELILGCVQRKEGRECRPTNEEYLKQKLVYSDNKLVDAEGNGVMMGWEAPLMDHHAKILCQPGGDILNIGFGLGLIDSAIQKLSPRSHTIIEAHPDVYQYMIDQGWDKKPGVTIIFGKWQDVLEKLEQYDGIFFDTFGEYYEDLREFHDVLSDLLREGGVYSFFNGLAATNEFFHDVYCCIAQLELEEMGFEVEYGEVDIDTTDNKIWEGINGKYFQLKKYKLPVVKWKSSFY